MAGRKRGEKLEPVIGLEIHIELATESKMFCGCSAQHFGIPANTHVCPVCLGLPGALPVPNHKAIDWTILVGLAFGAKIAPFSKFDRKNYFYPDLPKGYQISQYDQPLCLGGALKLDSGKKVPLKRVHLEEDTGKLVHTRVSGKPSTLVDFNRSGVPLVEIVTEPDIAGAEEAKMLVQKLSQVVMFLGVSDCDMEKGSMRLEANVSLRPANTKKLPQYKVEVKNLNSFRFLEKALSFEIERQGKLIAKGEMPAQETRGYDEKKGETYSQRFKEEAQDYRYFPEPDIPPIRLTQEKINKIKKLLPELPEEKEQRFVRQYKLSLPDARRAVVSRSLSEYVEEAIRVGQKHKLPPALLASTIINKRIDTEKLSPAQIVAILIKQKRRPKMDEKQLAEVVKSVIKDNPKAVADYKKGKEGALDYLVGQVMAKSRGQADPGLAREKLKGEIK